MNKNSFLKISNGENFYTLFYPDIVIYHWVGKLFSYHYQSSRVVKFERKVVIGSEKTEHHLLFLRKVYFSYKYNGRVAESSQLCAILIACILRKIIFCLLQLITLLTFPTYGREGVVTIIYFILNHRCLVTLCYLRATKLLLNSVLLQHTAHEGDWGCKNTLFCCNMFCVSKHTIEV